MMNQLHILKPFEKLRLKKLLGSPRLQKLTIIISFSLMFLVSLLAVKVLTHTSFVKLPTLTQQSSGVQIFDRNDKLVCVVQQNGDRKPVPLKNISNYMKQAVIGVEDHNFYHHMGIDPFGVARAVYVNTKAHQWLEGGSTITQQLMKTMYFGHEDRTARRKIMEAFMALDVETCYSKDTILETYLNQVYFGRGAYGIERASQAYFSKTASQLNLPESAFLAALIKAPSDLGSPHNLNRAKKRQKEVLNGMVECGFISSQQAGMASTEKLKFKAGPHKNVYPYYVQNVIGILKNDLGENEVWKAPLKVYTNLDQTAQAAAERALTQGVTKAPAGLNQGALVSIDLADGSVIALVGGVGTYESHQWNRAINPHTAGSSFKPFVYLAGLIHGTIGPDSVIYDEPIVVHNQNGTTYTPQNFDGQYKGVLTIRNAIALSRNVCAVKVGQDTGIENVIDTARKAGISSSMDPYPSLALGTCAVSPLEMANAYATLARGGEFIEPRFIRHINKADGALIKEYKSAHENRLPSEQVYQLVDCLEDVVKSGTGTRAQLPGIAVAGKTGTADESKDVWFTGFTPDVVTAVWAGNDDNHAIHNRGITGGTIAAGIWSNYMTSYYKTHEKPTAAFINPQTPLTREVPYFAYLPQAVGDTVEAVSDTVESISEPIAEGVQKVEKATHKGGFFRRLANHFKHWF